MNKRWRCINGVAKCVFSRSRLIVLKGLTRLHAGLLIVATACQKLHQRAVRFHFIRARRARFKEIAGKCDRGGREQLHA